LLLLTRREGERVIVTVPGHGQIVVKLVAVEGRKARLGFVAPKGTEVWREELLERPPTGERPGVV
jgi:carbon storage regulator CsrA